jgi:hypothetical protein
MSEHMPASIKIGGTIDQSLVPRLCEVVDQEQVSLEFGDDCFAPGTAEDLLAARTEQDGALILQLCDAQARWGWFESLEAFLTQHGIPFDRQTDANFAYGACLAQFRPGRATRVLPTDSDGRPVVEIAAVRPAALQIAQAIRQFEHAPKRRRLEPFRRAHRLLKQVLATPLYPLPTFTMGGAH